MTLLSYITLFSPLLPIIIGIAFFKHLTRVSTLILVLCSFSILCDISSYVWALLYGNNYWIIHLYQIIELAVLGAFYQTFLNNKFSAMPFWGFAIVYIIVIILILQPANISSTMISLKCLLVITYGIWGYLNIFNNSRYLFIDKSPEFWFNTAMLIYFSGSLFSWSMFNLVHQSNGAGSGVWSFHNISSILRNLLFAIGLWKTKTV